MTLARYFGADFGAPEPEPPVDAAAFRQWVIVRIADINARIRRIEVLVPLAVLLGDRLLSSLGWSAL